MAKKTLLEMIDDGFFPNDDQGRPVVPRVGYPEHNQGPDVTIITTGAPGLYPIVGIGCNYAMQFDENGIVRPDYGTTSFERFTPEQRDAESLVMPTLVKVTRYAVQDKIDGSISGVYTTRFEADMLADEDDNVVELVGEDYVIDPQPEAGPAFSFIIDEFGQFPPRMLIDFETLPSFDFDNGVVRLGGFPLSFPRD